ncbi:alpha/beta fold hydrolase [Streptomyces johnsoniae]|uniref:Alpha/beta fold hydrolase n=1 Tax=Streptomyces johnsoniae TaxID=3075532 RepID=A0ABU2S6N7_9ACTN|nr:alpha/beta fold hydrolase [Streptomyces sp. DSM 41886]MDT0444636.1 alpha/beta fold hydrolase [Streptomyces sp. DSM 41886]
MSGSDHAHPVFTPAAVDSGTPPDAAGPPLLLVHGWGGDGGDWAPLMPLLGPHHRLLVPDLPGHGGTPRRTDRCTPRDVAADLGGWLHRRGTGPVIAVGHSMGEQVVTALAVGHPHLVRSMVTVAAGYGGDSAEAARLPAEQEALRREGASMAVAFVRRACGGTTPRAVRERHERLMAAMDAELLARYREGMYLAPGAFGPRPAAEAYLRRRGCPALSVHASPAAAAWERTAVAHP